MGASLTREQRAAIEGMGRSAAEMLGKRPPSPTALLRCRISSVDDGGMLTVELQGAEISIPASTACAGAKAGKTAIVASRMGSLIAVGIVADDWSDNPNVGPQGPTGSAPTATEVSLTANTALLNYNSYTNSSVRFGNLLILQCSIALSKGTNWSSSELTLFTLPAGNRPSAERTLQRAALVITADGANTYARTIKVRTDGAVRFVNDGSTSNVSRVMLPGIVVRM